MLCIGACSINTRAFHITVIVYGSLQNVQYNPIFNAGGAGYFVPTMPQAQRGFFTPANVSSIRPTRAPWTSGVRPNQAAGAYSFSLRFHMILIHVTGSMHNYVCTFHYRIPSHV